jgi:hypothetical protein
MVVHACNPSAHKAKARGLRVQGQLELHREPLLLYENKQNPQTH